MKALYKVIDCIIVKFVSDSDEVVNKDAVDDHGEISDCLKLNVSRCLNLEQNPDNFKRLSRNSFKKKLKINYTANY